MFNFKKFFQSDLSQAPYQLETAVDSASDHIEHGTASTPTEITEDLPPDAQVAVKNLSAIEFWNSTMKKLESLPPEVMGAIKSMPEYKEWALLINRTNPNVFREEAKKWQVEGVSPMVRTTQELQSLQRRILDRAEFLSRQMQSKKLTAPYNSTQTTQQTPSVRTYAVTAQVRALNDPSQRLLEEENFITHFLPMLIKYDGKKRQNDRISFQARDEILRMVSPMAEENAKSALERIQSYDAATGMPAAEQELRMLFNDLISPGSIGSMSEPKESYIMSTSNPEGIVKFNLSDHILNNQPGFIKTAADQFGQQYVLYGPSEKRICPKLRGKGGGQPGSGDVVSEYICRHHCLDGIVIDDNKTICGEALWRANVMDKFSREYVDADGNTVGGYLNKRFEINRNVPEENKMRLKPGELRKPRPASQGNLEARMQDMRNKEGEKRGYRPAVNTGEPFNWAKDADQNNVEVDQSERDRREEASGHELVQYTNKDKQENNPKKAFNLRPFKTSQIKGPYPFNDKIRQYSKYPDNQLEFAVKDADEAASAIGNENADQGWYRDDVHTIVDEIKKRQKSGSWSGRPIDQIVSELQTYNTSMSYGGTDGSAAKEVFTPESRNGFNLQSHNRKNTKVAQFLPPNEKENTNTNQINEQRADLKQRGITISKTQHGEFRVNFANGTEDTAYYTNDMQDAIDTGWAMSREGNKTKTQHPGIADQQYEEDRGIHFPTASRSIFNLQSYKTAQMTGPRGPIGPDNPQSDDLGLSPDFDNFDESAMFHRFNEGVEEITLPPGAYDLLYGINENADSGLMTNEPNKTSLKAQFDAQIKQIEGDYGVSIDTGNADNETMTIKVNPPRMSGTIAQIIESDILPFVLSQSSSAVNNADLIDSPEISGAPTQTNNDISAADTQIGGSVNALAFNLKSFKAAKHGHGITYKGEDFSVNPFAICNTSTGGKKEDSENYESCVGQVKQQDRDNQKKKLTSSAFNLSDELHNKFSQSLLLQRQTVQIHPNLLSLFDNDSERAEDFLESLSDDERGIINDKAKDVNSLKQYVLYIQDDIDGSAKALEMEG